MKWKVHSTTHSSFNNRWSICIRVVGTQLPLPSHNGKCSEMWCLFNFECAFFIRRCASKRETKRVGKISRAFRTVELVYISYEGQICMRSHIQFSTLNVKTWFQNSKQLIKFKLIVWISTKLQWYKSMKNIGKTI